jgi:hypothetical protein
MVAVPTRMGSKRPGVAYSLVVSIESPNVEIDLWTPVQQQITSAEITT